MAEPSSFGALEKRIFQLEIELQEFRQLFSMSLDMICIADVNSSTFLKVNPAFQRNLGYSEEELINRPFSDFIHPDDIESTQKIVKEKLRQGAKVVNFENRYRCKDGSYKWLSWVSHPNPEQGKTYAVARDVTDQKQMAKKRDESEKKYRSLFYNAQVALFRTSIDGQLIEINNRYAEIAGYDTIDDCMAEYSPKSAWKDPEARNEFLKRIQKTGSVSDYEALIIRKDGTAAWILFSATVFPDEGYIEGSIVNITDRKQADQDRKNLQNQLTQAQKMAKVGHYLFDVKKKSWTNSAELNTIFGIDDSFKRDVSGWLQIVHPDYQDQLSGYLKDHVLTQHQKFDMEYKIVDQRTGQEKWIHGLGDLKFDENDEPIEMFGTIQDITERRRMEESLRLTQFIFDKAAIGIFHLSSDGQILTVNEQAAKNLGYTKKELSDMTVFDIDPNLKQDHYDPLWQTLSKNKHNYIKTFHRHKNGNIFPVEITANLLEYNNEQFSVSFVRDITEEKKAEDALRKSEERLSGIVNSMADWIWEVDPDGRYLYCSENVIKILGYSPGEMIGKTPFDFMAPDEAEKISKAFSNIVTQKKTINDLENWNICKDGREICLLSNGVPIISENEKVLGYRGVDKDITERKQANKKRKELEAQIQQAQKMEAIGTLAGGIAHDFNNILSGILGYAELAQVHMGTPEKAVKHIEQVIKGAHRATDLTRQILTFSRQGEYQKQPFKISLEIKEALKLLRSSIPSTIEIKTRIDSPKKVLADPIKIHQVIMNLCANSYHAMRKTGGILTVSLTDVEISESNLFRDINVAPGEYIKLEVSDTGHGMDKKTLDRAFDPYFTTKEKGDGTGFGLAIVQAIVEEHDGFCEVISEPDKGTSFFIYFPIVREEINGNAPQIEQAFQVSGKEAIMVVDDEGPIRESCKLLMEDW